MGKSAYTVREDVAHIVRDLICEARNRNAHEVAELLFDRLEARGLKIVEAPR